MVPLGMPLATVSWPAKRDLLEADGDLGRTSSLRVVVPSSSSSTSVFMITLMMSSRGLLSRSGPARRRSRRCGSARRICLLGRSGSSLRAKIRSASTWISSRSSCGMFSSSLMTFERQLERELLGDVELRLADGSGRAARRSAGGCRARARLIRRGVKTLPMTLRCQRCSGGSLTMSRALSCSVASARSSAPPCWRTARSRCGRPARQRWRVSSQKSSFSLW